MKFDCEAPSQNCKDYIYSFLCGYLFPIYFIYFSYLNVKLTYLFVRESIHCNQYIIQMVPDEDDDGDVSQPTVCQYFADRMWEVFIYNYRKISDFFFFF